MKKEELLRNPEYWIAHIQNDLFNMVDDYRKSNNLKQKDLADLLKVSKGYVSQILNGDFDHKISKLVDLALTFNRAPIITYENLEDFIKMDAEGKNPFYRNVLVAMDADTAKPFTINISSDQKLQPILSEDTDSRGAIVVDFISHSNNSQAS